MRMRVEGRLEGIDIGNIFLYIVVFGILNVSNNGNFAVADNATRARYNALDGCGNNAQLSKRENIQDSGYS